MQEKSDIQIESRVALQLPKVCKPHPFWCFMVSYIFRNTRGFLSLVKAHIGSPILRFPLHTLITPYDGASFVIAAWGSIKWQGNLYQYIRPLLLALLTKCEYQSPQAEGHALCNVIICCVDCDDGMQLTKSSVNPCQVTLQLGSLLRQLSPL